MENGAEEMRVIWDKQEGKRRFKVILNCLRGKVQEQIAKPKTAWQAE